MPCWIFMLVLQMSPICDAEQWGASERGALCLFGSRPSFWSSCSERSTRRLCWLLWMWSARIIEIPTTFLRCSAWSCAHRVTVLLSSGEYNGLFPGPRVTAVMSASSVILIGTDETVVLRKSWIYRSRWHLLSAHGVAGVVLRTFCLRTCPLPFSRSVLGSVRLVG